MSAGDTLPAYEAIEFPAPPADRPYVILNMVMSADGKIVIEGNEQGLGSEADQYLMRALRVHADVVMNGAGTLRQSGASPLLDHPELDARRATSGRGAPLAAVLSRSADLPLEDRFFTSLDFEAAVFIVYDAPVEREQAIAATGRTVVRLPAEQPMHAMLRWMRDERDARLLLVEGGAHINGSLLDAGLVDEIFITIGSVVVGGDGTLTAVAGDRPASREETVPLDLVSAIPAPGLGEVYLRYRVRR